MHAENANLYIKDTDIVFVSKLFTVIITIFCDSFKNSYFFLPMQAIYVTIFMQKTFRQCIRYANYLCDA